MAIGKAHVPYDLFCFIQLKPNIQIALGSPLMMRSLTILFVFLQLFYMEIQKEEGH